MTEPQRSWQSGQGYRCRLPRLSLTIMVSAVEAGVDMVRHNNKGRSKRSLARFVGLEMSYCQIWCLSFVGHAAIWLGLVVSIPSLNVTPVMTLAR